jgi:anion-transporting  ArsA/GET3 family ATPase
VGGLLDQRLWLVTGKGGVGRSTLSAALAVAAVRNGHKTLVCEFNAEERVAPLLGYPTSGPRITQLEPLLWSANLRPEDSLREYGLMVLRFEALYKAVFENRLVRQFLRFVPSLQELVLLGKALFHVQERGTNGAYRFDTVLLDAPATGHAVSLFRLPQVLLDTVPPGPLAKEAQKMRDLLVDPTVTAPLVATLPEEMPLSETAELVRALREKAAMQPRAILLNGFVPSRFDPADREALSNAPQSLALARDQEARARASREALETLRALNLPIYPVPQLFTRTLGRAEMERLADALTPLVKGEPP